MKHKKEKFDSNERRRKFSLRKVSGIGAVSAVIGVVSFLALPLDTVSASETGIKVNYKYATTDELTESEKNLIVNELPQDLVDGSDLFVIYRKDSANNVLPNTGSNVLPLASVVGAGLLLIAYSIERNGKTGKKIVKSMLSFTIVGGALTVTTVSALTVATLANYNHTETVTAGATLPDGKMNIPGYHFVGYIDGKNVNHVEKAPTAALQGSVSSTQPQEEKTQDNKKIDTVVPAERPEKEKGDDVAKPTNPPTDKDPVAPKDDEPVKPVDTKVIDRVIKVDESGNTLEDVTGYTKVSTSQPVETREVQDGQTVIVRTVTEVYKKDTTSEEKPAVDVLKETNLVVPSTLVEVLSEEVVEEETTAPTTPTETSVPVTPTVETPMPVENSTDTAPVTESSAEEDKKEELPTPVETPSTSSTPAPETTVKKKKVIRTVRTTEDLPFEVVVKEDSSLAEGEAKVETEGKLGKKVSTQKITLVDDVETAKETISETREEPQNKVVLIGTKKVATQPTASEVVTSVNSDATPAIESKETTPETPLPGYYTVEVTESENKTVVTDREKVRELVKDRTPFLNLVAPDGEKLVQIKITELLDNSLFEGQRRLSDIQASYVTVQLKRKRDENGKDDETEKVLKEDVPLLTATQRVGTKQLPKDLDVTAFRTLGGIYLEWQPNEGLVYTVQKGFSENQLTAVTSKQELPVFTEEDTNEQPMYYKVIAQLGDKVVQESQIIKLERKLDSDKDGLNDEEEEKYSTDKFVMDTDQDGLTDFQEVHIYKTDPLKVDTDGDRLSDYDEIAWKLNPLKPDTDDNGITDDLEDLDQDGLTNYEESIFKSNALQKDTDFDGLDDKSERDLGTNPNELDTDGDGVSDQLEIELGLNPLKKDSKGDGINDGDRKFSKTIQSDKAEVDPNIVPTITTELPANKLNSFYLYKIDDDHPVLNKNLPGYLGSAYEFKAGLPITSADVTFDINPELLTADSQPILLYFNEDKWEFEVVKEQHMEGNKLVAKLEHFSPYTIVDAKKKFNFDGVTDKDKQENIKKKYDNYLKEISKELDLKDLKSKELSAGDLSIFANLAYKNHFDEFKATFEKNYKDIESNIRLIESLKNIIQSLKNQIDTLKSDDDLYSKALKSSLFESNKNLLSREKYVLTTIQSISKELYSDKKILSELKSSVKNESLNTLLDLIENFKSNANLDNLKKISDKLKELKWNSFINNLDTRTEKEESYNLLDNSKRLESLQAFKKNLEISDEAGDGFGASSWNQGENLVIAYRGSDTILGIDGLDHLSYFVNDNQLAVAAGISTGFIAGMAIGGPIGAAVGVFAGVAALAIGWGVQNFIEKQANITSPDIHSQDKQAIHFFLSNIDKYKDRKYYITGHSLGGRLALVANDSARLLGLKPKTRTYDPFGTYKNIYAKSYDGDVKSYVNEGEFLSKSGYGSRDDGTTYVKYIGGTHPFDRHMMNWILEGFIDKKFEDSSKEAIFEKLTKSFVLNLGAGRRGTDLVISKDGSIKGITSDVKGNPDPGHPKYGLYISDFTGKLTNVVKVKENEYKLSLEGLKYEKPGVSTDINGTEVETTYPFGLVDNNKPTKEIILYRPGKKIKELPAANGFLYNRLKQSDSDVLTRDVLYIKDTGWAFVASEQPFRKVSVEDETIIKEIIENVRGGVYQFSKLVKPKSIVTDTKSDFYVSQFNPGELIDYYNTYKGDKTYQLEDVIKDLTKSDKEINEPLKYYTENQWRELANDKKYGVEWFYSRPDNAFYEVAKGGRGGAAGPLYIEPSNQWRVTGNDIEVSTNYEKFLFKKNNKDYKGGLKRTPYYVSKKTFLRG